MVIRLRRFLCRLSRSCGWESRAALRPPARGALPQGKARCALPRPALLITLSTVKEHRFIQFCPFAALLPFPSAQREQITAAGKCTSAFGGRLRLRKRRWFLWLTRLLLASVFLGNAMTVRGLLLHGFDACFRARGRRPRPSMPDAQERCGQGRAFPGARDAGGGCDLSAGAHLVGRPAELRGGKNDRCEKAKRNIPFLTAGSQAFQADKACGSW